MCKESKKRTLWRNSRSKCEVKDIDCIWARAYDRTKYDGDVWKLLEHVPTIRNHDLTGTSSWGNFWLEKDHCAN